jgi:glycosyltransferase 2 family protein
MTTVGSGARTEEQNTTTPAPFAHALRVLVAVGLTVLLLWQSDPRAVWEAARGADWRFVVLACVLVALDRVLMAYRWWTLLAPVGRPEGRHYDSPDRPDGRRDSPDRPDGRHDSPDRRDGRHDSPDRPDGRRDSPDRPDGRHDSPDRPDGAGHISRVRSADLQVGQGGWRPPIGTVLRIFFVSTFVGTFLPASVGGDAVRAYGLSKEGVGGVAAVASVLMDRLLGVISILVVGIAGAFLARDLIDIRALFPAFAVLTVACAAALAVVFSPRAAVGVAALLAFMPRGRETGTRLVAAIQRYASLHLPMVNVLLCSIAVQVLRVLQTYCLGLALGLAVPLGVYFALVPTVLLIVLLPITINGIGTTQAGFVWLFGRAGVASAPAFALSVLFLGIAVVGNLPGGILYLFGGKRP